MVLLTFVMMIAELVLGHMTGSLALTADGWHMGTHVGALGLTLAAYWYARTRAGTDTFAFGTGKIYALAGFTSGILLAIVALWMIYEGVDRLIDHPDVNFGEALPIAIAGFVVNLISAKLLGHSHHYGHDHGHAHEHAGHDQDHAHHVHAHDEERAPAKAGTLDFNLRAAYIHILADALTSLAAIGALTLGRFTDLWFLDPVMGFVGGGVILWWTVSLCMQASRQLLDVSSSPAGERVVRERLEAIDDVKVADLHVWELGPGRRSCIVSLVTASPRDLAFYRDVVLSTLECAHLTIEIHHCDLAHGVRAAAASPLEVAHRHEH